MRPTPSPGLGPLATARDLFAKLAHDLRRVEQDPSDPYAAFDFFVTAEHLVDWVVEEGDDARSLSDFRREPLLAVVAHIASGAKHFIARDKRHTSVRHVDLADFEFGNEGTIYVLMVSVVGAIAATFRETGWSMPGGAVGIEVDQLARAVFAYWQRHFKEGVE